MMKRWRQIGLMAAVVVMALVLTACGSDAGAGDPGAAVVDFFQAKVDGDLAALHQPVAPEDERAFLVSVPYRTVDLVTVVSSRASSGGRMNGTSTPRERAASAISSESVEMTIL